MIGKAKEKMASFTPKGKKHWNVMLMVILNVHAFFVAMTTKFKLEWGANFKQDPEAAIEHPLVTIQCNHSLIKATGIKTTIIQCQSRLSKAIQSSAPDSQVIMDNLMLHKANVISLFGYFVTFLETLHKYRVTVNIRKGQYLPP